MNEYIFEITQVLKKEIRIKCISESYAEKTINDLFETGNIKLTQDDCIQSDVKLIKSKEDDQPSLFDEGEIK